jgi:hypothetical protein
MLLARPGDISAFCYIVVAHYTIFAPTLVPNVPGLPRRYFRFLLTAVSSANDQKNAAFEERKATKKPDDL